MNAEVDLFKAFAAYFGIQTILGFGQLVSSFLNLSYPDPLKHLLVPKDLSDLRIIPILLSIDLCPFSMPRGDAFQKRLKRDVKLTNEGTEK